MEQRGMEAVAEKGSPKKRPVLAKKGKGPGMAIMIAVGKPKGPPRDRMRHMGRDMEDESMDEEESPMYEDRYNAKRSSMDPIIAKLEARIAALESKLDDMMGEEESEQEDGEYEDEED